MIQDSINRRTLLRGIATSAIIPAVGTEIGSAKPSDKHIVGTATKEATEAAKNKAAKVDRVIDFSEIGDAVAGKFPDEAIKGLKNRPDVRYIEADGTMEALGQTLPWGVDRIDADVAHQDGSTGSGADIAILDSGIDSDHPDLKDNLGKGYAVVRCDGDCSTSWDDDHDHGTHCAGIANAVNNSDGVVGVSAEATLHAVKVLDEYGTGTWSGIAEGIKWVADKGYDVASMSFGASSASSAVRDAVKYAYDKGVLLAAAAGNDGSCTDCVYYPAAYSEVIAVSSTDSSDELSYFSSTGPEIELAAPGSSIYSTVVDGYASYSGTSMACPHVSGAGGMVMASGKSNTEARQVLRDSAEDIGLSSNEQGNGLLDVEAAVGGGDDTTAPTEPTNLTSPSHSDTSVDLDWDASTDDESGVSHYNVYLDGTKEIQSTNTSVTVDGLASGTSHEFYVTAVDGSGNESGDSNTISVTTNDFSKIEIKETSGTEVEYEFDVESDLQAVSTDSEDSVEGMRASGTVSGNSDTYKYTGDLVSFAADGDLTVVIDGQEVTPRNVVSTHTLTIEGIGSYDKYEFEVNSDLKFSDALGGSANSDDSINGSVAEGAVYSGRDSYTYTGNLLRFAADGDVTVFLDGEVITPGNVVSTHTITIEGTGSYDKYEFEVDNDLSFSDALGGSANSDDSINGSVAEGAVYSARDSYTYSGKIFGVSIDGNVNIYLDGEEKNQDSLTSN